MICPTCKRAFLVPSAPGPTARPAPSGKLAAKLAESVAERVTEKAGAPLPFCSERCRAADLGNWLNGNYRITTNASEDELDRGPDADPEN